MEEEINDCLPTLIIKTFENLMAAGDVYMVLHLLEDRDVQESLRKLYPTDYSDFMFPYVCNLYNEALDYKVESWNIEKYNEMSYLYEDYLTICESLSLGESLFTLNKTFDILNAAREELCLYIHKPKMSIIHKTLVNELPF